MLRCQIVLFCFDTFSIEVIIASRIHVTVKLKRLISDITQIYTSLSVHTEQVGLTDTYQTAKDVRSCEGITKSLGLSLTLASDLFKGNLRVGSQTDWPWREGSHFYALLEGISLALHLMLALGQETQRD